MNNGILLFMLALFLAGRYIWRGLPEPSSSNVPATVLYKRKILFRCGVLACSVLALLGMFYGESRTLPFILMIAAGFCQCGAMRQKTKDILTAALLQKTICPKTD